MIRFAPFSLFALVLCSAILHAETPRIEVVEAVPPLSIESLYHPEDRFKYAQSATPATQWSEGNDGTPLLLIKRDSVWHQFDPRDASEIPYRPTDELVANLRSLGDIDQDLAKKLIQAWIGRPNPSLKRGLIRVDDSIAIIGTQVEARWITRSAATWKEVSLSPDAKLVAYVDANDLFVMEVSSGRIDRMTNDGSATRLNGILDWVYQEEIYGRGNYRGYWWREDSSAIAFLKLDTSAVREFTVTGSKHARGEAMVERYPKAGDPIPRAELWNARLIGDGESRQVVLTSMLQDKLEPESLVTRVGWDAKDGALLAQVANRIQNKQTLYRVNTDRPTEAQVVIAEQCDKWLEVSDLPKQLSTGEYLRLSDLPTGRRRLWRISQDGSTRQPVTPEDFDVREIVHVDSDDRFVFVTGDLLRGSLGQHLYQVNLQELLSLKQVTDEMPWHVVSISHDVQWLLDHASSVSTPTTMKVQSLGHSSDPAKVINQERLRLRDAPAEIFWQMIHTDDGLKLPAYIIRPPGRDRAPVLIEIYGGPLTPTVRDGWQASRYLFYQYLARQGIGVVVVDNRSSGGRGLADSWSIHRRMGEVETNDLVFIANWLSKQAWVDPQRLALRGWSFGGFLTLHAMTHCDKFAAGIAGGSVTDWRNYDAVYTERYMGLPSDNAAGYDSTSPTLAAKNLHGRVLMIHGEVDDNVHLANTLQMAGALQKAGKTFDLMIYPGAAHAVHEPAQNFHLMKTTMEFLQRELSSTTAP